MNEYDWSHPAIVAIEDAASEHGKEAARMAERLLEELNDGNYNDALGFLDEVTKELNIAKTLDDSASHIVDTAKTGS